jgi:hypothetical protein
MSTRIFITGLQQLQKRLQEAADANRRAHMEKEARDVQLKVFPPATINQLLNQPKPLRSLLKAPIPTAQRNNEKRKVVTPYLGATFNYQRPSTGVRENYYFSPYPSTFGFNVKLEIFIWNTSGTERLTTTIFESTTRNTLRANASTSIPPAEYPALPYTNIVEAANPAITYDFTEHIGSYPDAYTRTTIKNCESVIDDVFYAGPVYRKLPDNHLLITVGLVKFKHVHSYNTEYHYDQTAVVRYWPPPECNQNNREDRAEFVSTDVRPSTTSVSVEYEYLAWDAGPTSVVPATPIAEDEAALRAVLPTVSETTRRRSFYIGDRYQEVGDWYFSDCTTLVAGTNIDDDTLASQFVPCGFDVAPPAP